MSDLAPSAEAPWPLVLRYHQAERVLEIQFDDGKGFRLPAELLRVETPSAERRGHGASAPKIVAGKRDVAILRIEPMGHYAARLVFDDGHDTGLYGWRYLRQLGETRDAVWDAYLKELAARGLAREP